MVQYDAFGIPDNLRAEDRAVITTDDMRDGDVFIAAPDHQPMQWGHQIDMDKNVNEMNEEEREIHEALENPDDSYEELEDNFLMLANDGQIALVEDDTPDDDADIDISDPKNKGILRRINRDGQQEFVVKGMDEEIKEDIQKRIKQI